MQGEAPLRSSSNSRVGTWSQTPEDVTLWIAVPRPPLTKLQAKDVAVRFSQSSLLVSVAASPMASSHPDCEPSSEDLELAEAFRFELQKNLFNRIDVNESSWSIESNELCITLVKNPAFHVVWKTLAIDDTEEDNITFRDYEKLARHLEGEDGKSKGSASISKPSTAPPRRCVEGKDSA